MFVVVLLLSVVAFTQAIVDTDCTAKGAYLGNAVSCVNVVADKACEEIYKDSKVKEAGTDERPATCWGTAAVDLGLKNAAIAICPKTCGYCCKTTAYSCENSRIPFQDCSTITPQQCMEPTWRPLIEKDCPAACGFCNAGGCIDKSAFCKASNCVTKGMETFVADNCKRTCGLCAAAVTAASIHVHVHGAACVDKPNCASWVRKGFCTNPSYDVASRRASCGKACGLC